MKCVHTRGQTQICLFSLSTQTWSCSVNDLIVFFGSKNNSLNKIHLLASIPAPLLPTASLYYMILSATHTAPCLAAWQRSNTSISLEMFIWMLFTPYTAPHVHICNSHQFQSILACTKTTTQKMIYRHGSEHVSTKTLGHSRRNVYFPELVYVCFLISNVSTHTSKI